jgi:hypothetical protein
MLMQRPQILENERLYGNDRATILTNENVEHQDDREEKVNQDHDVQRPVFLTGQFIINRVVSSTLLMEKK